VIIIIIPRKRAYSPAWPEILRPAENCGPYLLPYYLPTFLHVSTSQIWLIHPRKFPCSKHNLKLSKTLHRCSTFNCFCSRLFCLSIVCHYFAILFFILLMVASVDGCLPFLVTCHCSRLLLLNLLSDVLLG